MRRFLNHKILLAGLCIPLLAGGCYRDEGNYDYRDSAKVTFTNGIASDYTFTVDTPFELEAPVKFSKEVENIDESFAIEWYMNREMVYTGRVLKYSFSRGGAYELVIKVINRETGETYISDKISINAKNNFDWGWMVLSDMGDGKSTLSFITPDLKVSHHIDRDLVEGGLGEDPRSIHYYYVLGSIPGVYVAGLPKIIINQGSGSVTLDGNSLQKDMWLADEFEGGKEPDDLHLTDFAFKVKYYALCSREGDVYIRGVGYDNHEIPYYGKYPAMPCHFEGGSRITHFAPFHNVTYWCADEENCILYDEQHGRFIAIVDAYGWDAVYRPDIVYLKTYDRELEIPSGVLRVDNMGAGTRCLAFGAYEKKDVDPLTGGLSFWSDYLSIIDVNGTGNYQIHEFAVRELTSRSHLISATDQYPFSGAGVLNARSIIRMSSNFEKNPYLYFTDGGRNLYVYSTQLKTHLLAYSAESRITGIYPSPIVCEFYGYGGNSPEPNFRLAVAQELGDIAIVDVSKANMVRLFEGFHPELELKTCSGFGDVKGVVWCTNWKGEY
ncbi:PKD-like family lipoprotein [Alistipes sp.]|uniref:PKD-like family lipoprotein n=1 Tax=Alistipes sp. TaxID=1872444 RepID=UPI0025C214C4|nr:PKD-like family lipoprotein [Alistipes sp.]